MFAQLKKTYNWFTTSSADPMQTSVAIKGALKIFIAQIIHAATIACTLGVACALGDLTWLNEAADLIGTLAYSILLGWGTVQTLFGLGRKIYLQRWVHPAI